MAYFGTAAGAQFADAPRKVVEQRRCATPRALWCTLVRPRRRKVPHSCCVCAAGGKFVKLTDEKEDDEEDEEKLLERAAVVMQRGAPWSGLAPHPSAIA